jgi:hypothetical protein
MVDDIMKNVEWLDAHVRSENIIELGMVLDKLSIQSMRLAQEVSDAYELMSKAEDDYKHSIALFVKGFEGSMAKAEREAEVEFKEKKEFWTACRSAYKRIDMFLERVDKVIESHRQRVSVIKQTSLKNLTGV